MTRTDVLFIPVLNGPGIRQNPIMGNLPNPLICFKIIFDKLTYGYENLVDFKFDENEKHIIITKAK